LRLAAFGAVAGAAGGIMASGGGPGPQTIRNQQEKPLNSFAGFLAVSQVAEFAVGTFLLIPQIYQITGGLQGSLHSKSMRRQAQGWHMGVVVARHSFLCGQAFKHYGVSHGSNLIQEPGIV